jgi:hypothetical protein
MVSAVLKKQNFIMKKWNLTMQTMPEFDGEYLCYISCKQECGNIHRYYKVVACSFNTWLLNNGEKVNSWKELEETPVDENYKIVQIEDVLKGLVSDVDTLLSDEGIEWQQAGYFNTAKVMIGSFKSNL